MQPDNNTNDLIWIKRLLGSFSGVLLMHLAAGIWWAATVTTKIDVMQYNLASVKSDFQASSDDRYRLSDAKRDFSLRDVTIDKNSTKIRDLERAVWKIGRTDAI